MTLPTPKQIDEAIEVVETCIKSNYTYVPKVGMGLQTALSLLTAVKEGKVVDITKYCDCNGSLKVYSCGVEAPTICCRCGRVCR